MAVSRSNRYVHCNEVLRDFRDESSDESASEMDVEVRFICGSIFE